VLGTVVGGKYRVEKALATGGMGAVWIAEQAPLGRKVALKVILRADLHPDARVRFEREAKIVAGLRCPHVVTLFDFGEHEGSPYIVLELLDGETLSARMRRGAVPIDEALLCARDIAVGLRSAHEMGVIHRDLKPANVFLVPDKDRGARAKLLDFGIAKPVADAAMGATEAGAIVGTPGYIAPEVALNGITDDPRCDLYAVGVMLFEMVSGDRPFDAPTALSLVMAHAMRPVPDVRERKQDVPAEVAALIARLMAKEPEARPRDGDALVAEIDALRARLADAAPPTEHLVTGIRLSVPERPSIAVQPFVAPGGSDEDALFAEGVGEDILVALSRFKELFVIAQPTMVQPGSRDTDALHVGQMLGVRYVVQGNVRRGGDRLRVSAKLVDTRSGAQIWAQRYDMPSSQVFELSDDITQSIVACVAGHVEAAQAERARKLPPKDLAALDWLARGRAHHHRRTREDVERSCEALDRAVELDPEYAPAHAWRACAYGTAIAMGVKSEEGAVPVLLSSLNRALVLDDNNPECQRLACELAFAQHDLVRAEHHHLRAIALNPNDARIVAQAGELAMYLGDFHEAAARVERAIRIDPFGSKTFLRLLTRVKYAKGDLEEAWRLWRCLDEGAPRVVALGAAIAARQGLVTEAQALAARVRSIAPAFSERAHPPPFVNPAVLERWLSGYDAVGLG
jgi:TolB-like protein/Tfp pilus assembly protein PilF